jgi:hypothetical protein
MSHELCRIPETSTYLGISSLKQTITIYPDLNYSLLNLNNED